MLVDPSEHDERGALDFTDETSTFGDRLVAARESMGMTQAQLAHRLGVKLQTLRNWEEDRSEPRANKLQMVAGMLNTSMVWLMSGQGAAPVPSRKSAAGSVGEELIAEFRAIQSEFARLGRRIDRFEKQLAAFRS
jgi:transcriptional regulator with XRE-family HTH domain